jgi:hypothetical protein
LGIFILETVHDGYSLLFVDRSLDHAWKVTVHILGLLRWIRPLFTTLHI